MTYLKSFTLPTDLEEGQYLLHSRELSSSVYDECNAYPFKLFPQKGLSEIEFSEITIFYGGNGSGKSTLLNLIAEKLELPRTVPFNSAPCMVPYLERCKIDVLGRRAPSGSAILCSDGVFDFLLDARTINDAAVRDREALYEDYKARKQSAVGFTLRSLDDYDALKEAQEVRRSSAGQYISARAPKNLSFKSNGESAYLYFTQKIGENALFLLDEPENSLSPKLQLDLLRFLEESARFFGCQLVISTHSPFLLSMKGARIYDLDARPVAVRPWTELENVRAYHDFFAARQSEFEK